MIRNVLVDGGQQEYASRGIYLYRLDGPGCGMGGISKKTIVPPTAKRLDQIFEPGSFMVRIRMGPVTPDW